MDPLTSIGLVISVIEFIGSASRLLSTAKESSRYNRDYRDTDAYISSARLELQAFAEQLREVSQLISQSTAPQDETKESLARLCAECEEISEECFTILEKLKSRESRLSKIFPYQILSKQNDLNRLNGRLQIVREKTDILLQLQMTQGHLQNSQRLQRLDSMRQTLIQTLLPTNEVDKTVSPQELQERAIAISFLNRENMPGNSFSSPELVSSITARLEAQKKLLKQLGFRVMKHRYESILKAHRSTFEWVFESEPSGPWSSFPDWLTNGSGIYWIKGEPATGKSTMMKMIFDSPMTQKLLKTWAEPHLLNTAAFFFWNSGSVVERSQVGLLRSLLYTVLERQPELLPVVLTQRWTRLYTSYALPGRNTSPIIQPWTQKELYLAFKLLASQNLIPLKLFLLVDGLDEYDGDHAEIVSLFQEITSSSNVKAIVSSRPLKAIEEAFRKCPQLSLQDLNQRDIHCLVDDTLKINTTIQTIMQEDSSFIHEAINLIASQSNGVFFQAQFATTFLLEEIDQSAGKDIQTIKDNIMSRIKLQLLPPIYLEGNNLSGVQSFDELFERAWLAIPPHCHSGASRTLQIMQAARTIPKNSVFNYEENAPLLLLDLVFADVNIEDVARLRIEPLSDEEVQLRCKSMADRLGKELPGFIVIQPINDDRGAFVGPSSRINYSHRGAREYTDSISKTKLLDYTAGTSFNSHLALIQSYAHNLKTLNRQKLSKEDLGPLLWHFTISSLHCAYHFEQSNDVNNTYMLLLDMLDTTMGLHHIKNLQDENGQWLEKQFVLETTIKKDKGWAAKRDAKLHWSNFTPGHAQPKEWETTFLSLAVQFGLNKYLSQCLEPGNKVLRAKKGRPLLDYALNPLPGLPHELVTRDTVAILMEHGADPNKKFKETTCWQNALRWQYEQRTTSQAINSPTAQKLADTRLEIFKFLIEKGAHVNECVQADHRNVSLAMIIKSCFSSCAALGELQELVAAQTRKSSFFTMANTA